MSWNDGLTVKQTRFCEAYASNGGNAMQAAISSGYSKKSAGIAGHQNIKKPNILQAIEKLRQTETKLVIATREERQAFWTEIMKAADEATKDRLKASELLGRSQGDFFDRQNIIGDIDISIIQEPK